MKTCSGPIAWPTMSMRGPVESQQPASVEAACRGESRAAVCPRPAHSSLARALAVLSLFPSMIGRESLPSPSVGTLAHVRLVPLLTLPLLAHGDALPPPGWCGTWGSSESSPEAPPGAVPPPLAPARRWACLALGPSGHCCSSGGSPPPTPRLRLRALAPFYGLFSARQNFIHRKLPVGFGGCESSRMSYQQVSTRELNAQ